MDSLVRGRVWPDGSFVLWRTKEGSESEPDGGLPIGLSKVANSHRDLEDWPERLQRGVKGITSYGQSMVRNAAYLLQQKYGGARLSFLTCTLPGSPEDTLRAAAEWPEIVRVYLQWLKRRLEKEKLSNAVVSVTEIQSKRFLAEGGMPLHLHVVFQGAHHDYQWCIRPDEFTLAWKRIVSGRVPAMVAQSFASALNVQHVRESARGYLGKYMTKGEEDICRILDANPELIDFLPRTWYNLSESARNAVKANMSEGEKVGLTLERWSQWNDELDPPFKYQQRVQLKDEEGRIIANFVIGEVACHWKRLVGVPVSKYDIVGL